MAALTLEYEDAYATSKSDTFNADDWSVKSWEQVKDPNQFGVIKNTNLRVNYLKELGEKLTTIPSNFKAHK